MAFRTTFARLARHDVGEHLAKVWKAHTHTEGQVRLYIQYYFLLYIYFNYLVSHQVIRMLSPFEQNVFGSFIKSYPAEVRVYIYMF